ncbi:MAG TPA: 2-phosphosulfolactate phosphatase [Myxococcota bacterium]|nr:2-phosphosulfolactate phosphatase [Myxococcota bacterium]
MSFTSQSGFDVRFEWGERGLRALAGESKVFAIVDVLSFTTCVAIACARGAEVLPYPWRDDGAETYAAARGARVAAPRGTAGALSLSPESLLGLERGAKLVLPSPNGSELSFAAAELGTVYGGALRNAASVAAALARRPGPVAVIAAGERWPDGSLRLALEDLLGAGAIIANLHGTVSPEAELARDAWLRTAPRLERALAECASGRELRERGFARDVELAAELDRSPIAPRLDAGAFAAERAP